MDTVNRGVVVVGVGGREMEEQGERAGVLGCCKHSGQCFRDCDLRRPAARATPGVNLNPT